MKPRNSIKNKTTKVDWRMSREVKSYDNKNNNKIKRKERTQSNESKMSYNVKIENNDAKGEDGHNDPRPSSSPSNIASSDYTSDSKPTTSPTKKRRLIPGIISNGHNEEGKERKAKLPHHDNHNNCQRVHSRSLLLGTLASDMIPLSNILHGHDIIQYHSPQRHKKCPVNIYTGYGMLSGSYAVLSSIETNGVAPRQLFRSMMQGFPPFDHSNDNKRDDISQQTERVNDSNTLFQEYHSNIASNNKISGRVLQYPTLQHYESLSSNNFDADRTSHHNEVERRSSQHQDHEDSNYIDSDNTIQRYYADLSETDIDGLLDTDEFHILCLSPNSINSSNT